MAGVFNIFEGAFDSSEAALLRRSYAIALHGMRATHAVDPSVAHRLAGSVVKVACSEPDSLRPDGSIDPARLAQRAILRMLQRSAPTLVGDFGAENPRVAAGVSNDSQPLGRSEADDVGATMLRLFERTSFAKL